MDTAALLDDVFGSLANSTRRDILSRLTGREVMNVSAIADAYPMSLAAVSKHVRRLEDAGLVHRRRSGNDQLISLSPHALKDAADYLDHYAVYWNHQLDELERYLHRKTR